MNINEGKKAYMYFISLGIFLFEQEELEILDPDQIHETDEKTGND